MLVIEDESAGETSLELRLPVSLKLENIKLDVCLLISLAYVNVAVWSIYVV